MKGGAAPETPPPDSEIICGIHPVAECLRAGRRRLWEVFAIRRHTSRRLQSVLDAAAARRVPVHRVSRRHLERLALSELHQGICARVAPYPFVALADILAVAAPADTLFLVVLDQIVDGQNLGSLARTALCAGVSGMLITHRRSAPVRAAVCRASAGAVEHLRIARVNNLAYALKQLKHQRIWVAGLDADAPQSIFETDLGGPIALVIGGEQKGIRPLVRSACDFLVSIPRQGAFDSLNAAAAGAVGLYEIYRQRMCAQDA